MLPCCPGVLLARRLLGRGENPLLPKPPEVFWTPNWHHGHAADLVLGCKCLKCFGGPGEIRTHDLFHAMGVRSITYRQSDQKQKSCATTIWTPIGLRVRFHGFRDSGRTPAFDRDDRVDSGLLRHGDSPAESTIWQVTCFARSTGVCEVVLLVVQEEDNFPSLLRRRVPVPIPMPHGIARLRYQKLSERNVALAALIYKQKSGLSRQEEAYGCVIGPLVEVAEMGLKI